MKTILNLLAAFIILLVSSTCKDFNSELVKENLFRIKKITETNQYGKEIRRHTFTYKEDKLILWKTYFLTDEGIFAESKKVTVTYKANTITAVQSKKISNEWKSHQKCVFNVQNNLITEKLVSRISFPECENCWKYEYEYIATNLKECKKYIRTDANTLQLSRKQVNTYRQNNLIKYEDYISGTNGELTLDYIKMFSYDKGEPTGWEAGIVVKGISWIPTEKMEYIREEGILYSEMYFVWDIENSIWKYFGSIDYCYNNNLYLIEEKSSSGTRIKYEYEIGKGNAPLIYCEPIELSEPVPSLKNNVRTVVLMKF